MLPTLVWIQSAVENSPNSGQGRQQGWAEGRGHNKNQGYPLFSCIPERKYFKSLAQKWEAVSRNVVLLPNTFIFKEWLRGCLFPTSQSQHYNQGTGYMNCSGGMLSTDSFDSNQQRHWIPAVPVRLKTQLRIKQPAGKGFTCFLLQIISPQWCCLIAKDTYIKKTWPFPPRWGGISSHKIWDILQPKSRFQ